MTTIKNILEWPVGYKSGGFVFTVKTAKKRWENNDGTWYQRLMLSDGKDEILAEVITDGNIPIRRNTKIRVIVCERIEIDINNKPAPALFIPEWRDDAPTISEPDELDSWLIARKEEIKGKCRYGIVCALIKRIQPGTPNLKLTKKHKEEIEELVEYIMSGE